MEKLELVDCLLALKPKEPIPFPQYQNSTGYGKPSFPEKYRQLSYFGTLVIFTLLNNDHSFQVEDALYWPDPPVYLSQCCCQN